MQPMRVARRWRAHTLLQPLAQPTTSRPLASFALPLAAVQGDMLPWLPIASAISLVRCCRSLHGGCVCIARLIADGFLRVVQSVEDTLFHPGQIAALVIAGISKSTMLRVVACARDWLDKCPPVFVDESLLPLALLRLAIKFEAADDKRAGAALKISQPLLGEKLALLSLECRLVEALWGAGGLVDGVGYPSQPLAR